MAAVRHLDPRKRAALDALDELRKLVESDRIDTFAWSLVDVDGDVQNACGQMTDTSSLVTLLGSLDLLRDRIVRTIRDR